LEHTEIREHFGRLAEWLAKVTQKIDRQYIELPIVAETATVQYRERVYCYELYHQLRLLMEEESEDSPYILMGEIDKRTHSQMRDHGSLEAAIPDFLVHEPGQMNSLVAMEVRSLENALPQGIEKDLIKLTALHDKANYHYAIYLIYGGNASKFERFLRAAAPVNEQDGIDLDSINLYWHRERGQQALEQSWT
jgi:hypothetical protein